MNEKIMIKRANVQAMCGFFLKFQIWSVLEGEIKIWVKLIDPDIINK